MKHCKQLVQHHRSSVLVAALTLLILGLAFLASPTVSSAQSAPNGTVPPIPGTQATVTVVHVAPFNADIDQTAVDICTIDNTVVPGLENIKYLESRTINVNADVYEWTVAPANSNCEPDVLSTGEFILGYNAIRTFVITGDGTNQPLRIVDVVVREGGGALYMPFVTHNTTNGG
jgi:hypothetical protein